MLNIMASVLFGLDICGALEFSVEWVNTPHHSYANTDHC